jgi:cytochrome c-type biogenesis protein
MDQQGLTLPLAFVAGLLSFASPCVLPLVPAYVGYLGGTAVTAGEQAGTRRETSRTFLHALLFVLGFMLIFVSLGASATFIGRLLLGYSVLLQRVGGVLLVVFGMRLMGLGWDRKRWAAAAVVVALVTFALDSGLLSGGWVQASGLDIVSLEEAVMMGLVVLAGADWGTARQIVLAVAAGILNFLASSDVPALSLIASVLIALVTFFLNRSDFFYAEKRLELKQASHRLGSGPAQTGYLRSLLFGVVFAAGWTPCVGPILAGILVVASQLHTVGQGIVLLTTYSLGLGVPFLLMGLAFGPLSKWLRKANRYLGIVSLVSGVLLVLMGVLLFTDSLAFLARYGDFLEINF